MFVPVGIVVTALSSEAIPIQLLEIRGKKFFFSCFPSTVYGKTCGCLLCSPDWWVFELFSVQLLSVLPSRHHGVSLLKVSSVESLLRQEVTWFQPGGIHKTSFSLCQITFLTCHKKETWARIWVQYFGASSIHMIAAEERCSWALFFKAINIVSPTPLPGWMPVPKTWHLHRFGAALPEMKWLGRGVWARSGGAATAQFSKQCIAA